MQLNFCPTCGKPLTKQNDTRYICPDGHRYHNNPHTATCIIFMNDQGNILYAKRGGPPNMGKYDFPGGFLNFEEDAYQAAKREMREELGIGIEIHDLQLIDTSRTVYEEDEAVCDFVFLCRKWQGTMRPNDDVAAIEWKPIEFMLSDQFAWQYPYLYNKLHAVANQNLSAS